MLIFELIVNDFYSSLKVTLLFQQNHMKKSADVPVISVLNRGGFKSVSVISSRLNDNDTVIVLAKSAGLASFIQKLKEHCAWVINFITNVYNRFLSNKKLVAFTGSGTSIPVLARSSSCIMIKQSSVKSL